MHAISYRRFIFFFGYWYWLLDKLLLHIGIGIYTEFLFRCILKVRDMNANPLCNGEHYYPIGMHLF